MLQVTRHHSAGQGAEGCLFRDHHPRQAPPGCDVRHAHVRGLRCGLRRGRNNKDHIEHRFNAKQKYKTKNAKHIKAKRPIKTANTPTRQNTGQAQERKKDTSSNTRDAQKGRLPCKAELDVCRGLGGESALLHTQAALSHHCHHRYRHHFRPPQQVHLCCSRPPVSQQS